MKPSELPKKPSDLRDNPKEAKDYLQNSRGFTIHQVIAVLDQDAVEEANFQARKEKVGSRYAYHGTKSDCMYSILRNGLRDLSNSHLMQVGAAYGAGIYLSTAFATAAGYSQPMSVGRGGSSASHGQNYGAKMPSSLTSTKFLCIVEFINEASYDKGNNIFVVTRESDIRIRFYLEDKTTLGYGASV